MRESDKLLATTISVSYPGKGEVLRHASLEMRRGEILGLAGSSGSGKSTLTLAIMNLLDGKKAKCLGSIYFNGRDLLSLREREMRHVRGREIALVLQSPASALNPMLRLGRQMQEAWRAHSQGKDAKTAIAKALEAVSLPSEASFLKRYPSQISTGQGQRVLIAMAILHSPELIVADEPTSALDSITQQEILSLFQRLNRALGMAILLVSHDLLAMASICDRIAILHSGQILECGETEQILYRPVHPYTQQLTAAFRAHATSRRDSDKFPTDNEQQCLVSAAAAGAGHSSYGPPAENDD